MAIGSPQLLPSRIWVDDLSVSSVGTRQSVVDAVSKGIIDFGSGMQKAGLQISPKSVVVCSQLEDARRIAQVAKQHGFAAQAASHGTCLG
eukprot:1631432-Pyramimonas_sp.AAC.1